MPPPRVGADQTCTVPPSAVGAAARCTARSTSARSPPASGVCSVRTRSRRRDEAAVCRGGTVHGERGRHGGGSSDAAAPSANGCGSGWFGGDGVLKMLHSWSTRVSVGTGGLRGGRTQQRPARRSSDIASFGVGTGRSAGVLPLGSRSSRRPAPFARCTSTGRCPPGCRARARRPRRRASSQVTRSRQLPVGVVQRQHARANPLQPAGAPEDGARCRRDAAVVVGPAQLRSPRGPRRRGSGRTPSLLQIRFRGDAVQPGAPSGFCGPVAARRRMPGS